MITCWNCHEDTDEAHVLVSELTKNEYCPKCLACLKSDDREEIEAVVDALAKRNSEGRALS